MYVEFRTYCGLAGDLQELLIGTSETNMERSILIPRTGWDWYRHWRMRIAKRTILKELELLTGKRHYEKNQRTEK
jgi:hypothetical protein